MPKFTHGMDFSDFYGVGKHRKYVERWDTCFTFGDLKCRLSCTVDVSPNSDPSSNYTNPSYVIMKEVPDPEAKWWNKLFGGPTTKTKSMSLLNGELDLYPELKSSFEEAKQAFIKYYEVDRLIEAEERSEFQRQERIREIEELLNA